MFEGSEALEIIKSQLDGGFITPLKSIALARPIMKSEREKDILAWGKYYFPDKFEMPFCDELHGYLVDICEEAFTDTLAPRGYAKTTIKSFLCKIYLALVKPEIYQHYLSVQSTSTKAIAVNLSIRHELETNELLRRDYGDQVTGEKWTEKQFVLKNGVIFSAIGAGESMRGINYNNKRPDYVDADDLYDEDDIGQKERIEKIARWFWGSLYKCVAKMKKVCFHLQGTAIAKNDLMHHLSNKPSWKFRKFQAVKDFDTQEVLWKEAETFEKLMEDKDAMGSNIFNRELQNDCRNDEDSIIKDHWIKLYDGNIPEDEEISNTMLGVDPAIGVKITNDPTGKALIYKTKNFNYYIHGVRNSRLTFDENIKDMQLMHNTFTLSNQGCRLEAISAFQGMGQELKRKTNVPVKMITSVKDKLTRLENVSGKFENGKVFINKNIPKHLLNELIEQITNNNPTHDDMRDAVVICLEDDTTSNFRMGFL